eukprot:SM000097S24783  [mRNA]  locus=s97:214572:218446:+ [translate_table: standard]
MPAPRMAAASVAANASPASSKSSSPPQQPPRLAGRDHVSRALLLIGVPAGFSDIALWNELGRWGPLRALMLERQHEGLVTAQFYDLRHARSCLRDIQRQHLRQQQRMQRHFQRLSLQSAQGGQGPPQPAEGGAPEGQQKGPHKRLGSTGRGGRAVESVTGDAGPAGGEEQEHSAAAAMAESGQAKAAVEGEAEEGEEEEVEEEGEEEGVRRQQEEADDEEDEADDRGLLGGRAVWAQFTVPPPPGPHVTDAHNQGTLVVFNIDVNMPLDQLRAVFEVHGSVKELRETPAKKQHKFVEFYDVRDAARALAALDSTEISGKKVKIEFSRPGGTQARRAWPHGLQFGSHQLQQPLADASWQQQVTTEQWQQQQLQPQPLLPPMAGSLGWPTQVGGLGVSAAPFVVPGTVAVAAPSALPPPMPGYMWPHLAPPLQLGPHPGHLLPALQPWMGPLPAQPMFPFAPGHPLMHDLQGHFAEADSERSAASPPLSPGAEVAAREALLGQGQPQHERLAKDTRRRHAAGSEGLESLSVSPRAPQERGVRSRGSPREAVQSQYVFDEFEVQANAAFDRTTLMIKNIPNKYSQAMLLALLDAHCLRCNTENAPHEPLSAYDFVYLPIDFKNRCNLGYAFVNFTTAQATLKLYRAFHSQQWEAFNSRKVCQVTYARVQGRQALEEHFRNSRFACDTDEYLPLVFNPPRNGLVCPPPIVAAGHLTGRGSLSSSSSQRSSDVSAPGSRQLSTPDSKGQ